MILKIQKLAYQAEAEIYNDFTIAPLHETELEVETDFKISAIIVAEKGREIIGSVRGKSQESVVVISRLSVLPTCQGNGIGKALMNEIEGMFPEKICFELFTGHKSDKNKRLYESMGYSWFKSEAVSEQLSLFWMRKTKG